MSGFTQDAADAAVAAYRMHAAVVEHRDGYIDADELLTTLEDRANDLGLALATQADGRTGLCNVFYSAN